MTNSRKPHVIVLRLAAVLLILVALSTSIATGRYARYYTTASGSDSARVAKFAVSAAVADDQNRALDLNLSAATDKKSDHYAFTVENDSEVRVAYRVTVTLPAALPDGVSMAMTMTDNEEGSEMPATVSDDKKIYTYSSELDFTDSHTWTLIFTGDPESVKKSMTLNGITVVVAAEQID